MNRIQAITQGYIPLFSFWKPIEISRYRDYEVFGNDACFLLTFRSPCWSFVGWLDSDPNRAKNKTRRYFYESLREIPLDDLPLPIDDLPF